MDSRGQIHLIYDKQAFPLQHKALSQLSSLSISCLSIISSQYSHIISTWLSVCSDLNLLGYHYVLLICYICSAYNLSSSYLNIIKLFSTFVFLHMLYLAFFSILFFVLHRFLPFIEAPSFF